MSVRLQANAFLTGAVATIGGAWIYGCWMKPLAGNYGGPSNAIMLDVSGGTSAPGNLAGNFDGVFFSVDDSPWTDVEAIVLDQTNAFGVMSPNPLAGSQIEWIHCSMQYPGSGSTYTMRVRREGQTAFTTGTISSGNAITIASNVNLGSNHYLENTHDFLCRGLFCQATTMTDAQLLAATRDPRNAPAGTNFHWLPLGESVNAGVNLGSSSNFTVSGAPTTSTDEPQSDIAVLGGTTAFSASGGASVAPSWPTTAITGSKDVLIIGMKPNTSGSGTVTTPAGWTLLGSITAAGGYGSQGADTGNCDLYVFTRDTDGTASGTLSVTINTVAAGGVAWGKILRVSAGSGSWNVAMATGSQTAGGNLSVTFGSDPGVATGDLVVGIFCDPTDIGAGAQFSAEAFSQTGVTFTTAQEIEEPFSATGNDIGAMLCYSFAASGSSTAAPSMTATAGGTTTNIRGPAVFLRMRAGTSVPSLIAMPTRRAVRSLIIL